MNYKKIVFIILFFYTFFLLSSCNFSSKKVDDEKTPLAIAQLYYEAVHNRDSYSFGGIVGQDYDNFNVEDAFETWARKTGQGFILDTPPKDITVAMDNTDEENIKIFFFKESPPNTPVYSIVMVKTTPEDHCWYDYRVRIDTGFYYDINVLVPGELHNLNHGTFSSDIVERVDGVNGYTLFAIKAFPHHIPLIAQYKTENGVYRAELTLINDVYTVAEGSAIELTLVDGRYVEATAIEEGPLAS